ncbi:hypothetical protein RSAG_02900 [Ruminococcus sp. 5_1_39BFAA]|nr:hypothetical protein RSAG_02900 [Ruminococcus sp. 5_1_39BFAA]
MLDKNDMKMLREMMEATVKETVEATVKETVEATVQKAIEPLQQDICDLKEEVNGVKLHLENVTDRNISILAENHGYLVKKFNEAVEAAHNNHVNTVQTSYLIEHVANLENRMQAVRKKYDIVMCRNSKSGCEAY